MKHRFPTILSGLLGASVAVQGAETINLKSGGLGVTLDAGFPRIVSYQTSAGVLAGQSSPAAQVLFNGKPAACRVESSVKTAESAIYQLSFPEEKVVMDLTVSVMANAVDLRVTRLVETGSARIHTLAFPGNPLLSFSTSQADAAMATCLATNVSDQFGSTFRERITPIATLKAGEKDSANYFFVSADKLAAGIGCGNFTDTLRTEWSISEISGVKTCVAQNPVWEFRMFDDEKPEMPWVKVFVTPDINDDGRADWQDAAIVCRRVMPKPFGHEFVKSSVGENIAMNFASGAQQPFLKILDEVKKIHLATDGLGNQVVIKGFSSEGHDSANTDYSDNWNERAGGLGDFTTLLNSAGAYNSRIGIHINATEAYPEAKRYRPEILRRDANGNFKGGWSWLDNAHMIDKVKDVRSGQLFSALEKMRKDLPKLDFVYVDTYWENGWPAAKTAQKINSLGLPMYSEGDCCIDPWITWGHWRGTKHTIQRFLWYSDRDLFGNDPILRAGRADQDGFMGWQNQHNFHNFIRNTFTQKLPAKFLQHFELLRWDPGKSAAFSDGVGVVKSGDAVTVSRNGAPLMSWTGGGADSCLFVPWPPHQPGKIYAWSDVAGGRDWQLPPSWKDAATVRIYQLTARGREGETVLPVAAGRIRLDLARGTPFVIYQNPPPPLPAMVWGEGGHLRDPGFDSYGFSHWKKEGEAAIADDANGNARLVLTSDGTVSQPLSGMQPGKLYAATVWAQATGPASAVLRVESGGKSVSNRIARGSVRHSAPNDPRSGSNYQRLRVVFTATSEPARIILESTPNAATQVEFDDVRVVETRVSPESSKHYFWEDFENVESGGYGPFTCCPGERTHLSESNPPHTRDTISGRYSLKSRDNGCVARTLASSLRLKPATKYRITCQTIGNGRLTAVSKGGTVMELRFPNLPDFKVSQVSGEFVTREDAESHLSLFRDGGDFIAIDDLAIDELGRATAAEMAAAAPRVTAIPDEKVVGMKVLYEEKFGMPLRKQWSLMPSRLPGTSITAGDGALAINGYANITIHADLTPLPADLSAVEARVELDGEAGETWGPGLALVWPGGQQLRVNLRAADGRFGVDSTAAPQAITGQLKGGGAVLRILLDAQSVIAQARCAGDSGWQKLAVFPRAKFPGNPSIARLGKTHGVEGLDDHSTPGVIGTTRYTLFRVYGK